MISHFGIRLAASAFTLAAVLQPHAGHAQAVAAAATTVLPHISITTMGTKGSPVVLIPGLSSPRATWDGIAPRIAHDHRVILVQVNGFGGTAPGDNLKPGLLDGVVADLTGYLAAQKLTKVDVIGHSMGGLLALMLAKAHPDRVGKVMIVDSLPFYGALFAPNATVEQLRPQAAAMRDMMAKMGDDKAAQAANAERVAAQMTVTPAAHAQVIGWMATADPRVSAQAMYEDLTTDLRPAMASIKAPITVVYPWNARLPKAIAEGLYKREYAAAPAVTFVDIPDAAHFAMLDQPAAFAAAVDGFLR